MSNKYKILEILKSQELTVKEISKQTKFSENEVRVYINRLKKDGLIREIGKKNRYKIYTAIKTVENTQDKILDKLKKGFIQYNKLFERLIKSEISRENLVRLAKEILDFELIKELEEMVS
ncbi:MAG: ArsR family transcriptional regulator [Promethearchaeota archaeon]